MILEKRKNTRISHKNKDRKSVKFIEKGEKDYTKIVFCGTIISKIGKEQQFARRKTRWNEAAEC